MVITRSEGPPATDALDGPPSARGTTALTRTTHVIALTTVAAGCRESAANATSTIDAAATNGVNASRPTDGWPRSSPNSRITAQIAHTATGTPTAIRRIIATVWRSSGRAAALGTARSNAPIRLR